MGLKFFNTLSRTVQDLSRLDAPRKARCLVLMLTLGLRFAHIGYWRTFVRRDLVRRYLNSRFMKSPRLNSGLECQIIKRFGLENTRALSPAPQILGGLP